jgi:hypothetical protein
VKEMLMEGKAKGRRTGIIGKAHAACMGFDLWRLECVMLRAKKHCSGAIHWGNMIRSTLGKHLVLFGFLLAIWSANMFPVQRAEHVLQATAVVSPQRLTALQRLSSGDLPESRSLRWVRYSRASKHSTKTQLDASVEHILLELGVHANAGLREIEQELEQMTLVEDPNGSLSKGSKRIRADRWKLASIEHQVQRFRLDREREAISKAARLTQTQNALADNATSDEALSTRSSTENNSDVSAVTISFRQPSNSVVPDVTSSTTDETTWSAKDKQTWNALLASRTACIRSIENAEQKMQIARMQAAGTIAITGAPRYGVVSGYASLPHILSILALSTSGAIGLGFLLRSPSILRTSTNARSVSRSADNGSQSSCDLQSQTPESQVPESQAPESHSTQSHIPSKDFSKLLAGHQIKHFGTIEIQSDSRHAKSLPSLLPAAADLNALPTNDTRSTMRLARISRRVEQLNNWALWSWVGLFLVRFLSDANWRELLFNAPLAAFSSIVLGVY